MKKRITSMILAGLMLLVWLCPIGVSLSLGGSAPEETTVWRVPFTVSDPFAFMVDETQKTPVNPLSPLGETASAVSNDAVLTGSFVAKKNTFLQNGLPGATEGMAGLTSEGGSVVAVARYIVKYKAGQADAFRRAATSLTADIAPVEQRSSGPAGAQTASSQRVTSNSPGPDYDLGQFEMLTLDEPLPPSEVADMLRAAGAGQYIEYIQPDHMLSLAGLSLELQAAGEDQEEQPAEKSQPEELPPVASMSPVLVAVIDTGMDADHELLAGYMTQGFNVVDGTEFVYDAKHPLAYAHGTHVAGLIAEEARRTGADVRILPIQVFDNGIAYTSDVLAAIAYAQGQGASIANCSFGTTADNPALFETIAASDMLFICAAGNSRRDMDIVPSYPAGYRLDNVISVGSVNADGGYSYYSNYGPGAVDIAARGRDVVSALPEGRTGAMSGTSMAAGAVTGAAASVRSLCDIADTAALRQRLLDTADSLDNLMNKVADGRRINADNALAGIIPTDILSLSPADDFDAHGYQPDAGEQFELYAQAGAAVRVAAGAAHTLVLKEDGTVWAFGNNAYGQLGDGTAVNRTTPVQVVGLNDVVSVAAGANHSFAIRADGTLWAWGYNAYGQLGDGSFTNRAVPVQIWTLFGVTTISGGSNHSLAFAYGDSVWAWGNNAYGQVGNDSLGDKKFHPSVRRRMGRHQGDRGRQYP